MFKLGFDLFFKRGEFVLINESAIIVFVSRSQKLPLKITDIFMIVIVTEPEKLLT